MARNWLSPAKGFFTTIGDVCRGFFRQKVGAAVPLLVFLFVLGLLFAFVKFAPILSPFVYPLF